MILSQEYQDVWSPLKKAFFKFIFCYFSLYISLMFFNRLFEIPFKWVGEIVLGIEYSYNINGFGSGDHTYAYVTLFMNIVLALFISTLWIILDRLRKNYNNLFYWFIVVLRIYLIFFMFTYGFVKLIQLQFPYPSLTRMLQPLGDFSPMGLAWTYLGYSKGYNLFMGIMEVMGGLLLIPKRTSTLGSFIIVGVMSHVAIMNFMFDIPVKIFSVHLTLIALFIFSTDIKRFINVFIKNKPTEAYNYYTPIKDKTHRKSVFWLKLIFTVILISIFLSKGIGKDRGKNSFNKPQLYGIWEVEEYIKEGDTLLPMTTDKERWQYLIIDKKNRTTVKTMDRINHPYKFEMDTINKKAKIYPGGTKSENYNFKYERLDNETLKLEGNLYFYNLVIKLKKKDLLLDSRDFNWINEKPFNR
ncbi:MAG: DoxX family protein [Algibacter sp.]